MTKHHRQTFAIEDELLKALQFEASEQKLSASEVIRQALKSRLSAQIEIMKKLNIIYMSQI